jgi:hypothetical protein
MNILQVVDGHRVVSGSANERAGLFRLRVAEGFGGEVWAEDSNGGVETKTSEAALNCDGYFQHM